jgi:hypothetical protein
MSMGKYFTIVLLIFGAGTSFAQFPRIDSMVTGRYMDDTLYIYGKFGNSIGMATIGIDTMMIFQWTDSLLFVKLPPRSTPPCGPVTATVNNSSSNSRTLSNGLIHTFTWNDPEFIHGSDDYYVWVYDFHSFFINHKGATRLTIPTTDSYYKLNFDFVEKKASIGQLVMDLNELYFISAKGSYRPYSGEYPKIDYQTTESCGAPLDVRTSFKNSIPVNKVKDKPFFSFSAYPNPSSKELIINFILTEIHNSKLLLYTLTGKIVKEQIISSVPGENYITWDISDLPNGSYILGLITQEEKKSQLIQIIH